ncbi:MAG: ABC transporter ATP-binding protein [Clostridiales bacterium]|nr:ABC transporter ATP-binding protein [Clostridiales bacterium]
MKNKNHIRLDNFFLSFQEIWKFDKRLFFVLLADVIINATLPFPNIILSGLIIDSIVTGNDFLLVFFYIALMFAISFLLNAVSTYLKKFREYLFIKFTNKLNNDISNKCMNMDFEQFNDSSFQDRILLINQISQGNNFFTNITTVFGTISQIITLVGIILIMTILNIWLLCIALAVIALQAVLHVINLRYNKQFQIDTINEQRKLGYVSQLAKDISAKKDTDMFNMSGFILKKIKSFQQNMLVFNIRRIKTNTFIEMATYLLSIGFQMSAYILIGMNAFTGKISIGDFTMGIASLINFMSSSSFVAMNVLNLNNSLFYIKKYKSFLNLKSKFDEKSNITINDIDLDNIEIEFRNVSFRYPNSNSFVLKNINLKINNKEKFAIVGYNGAGKTSFTLLLTRMYDPTEGSIHLNGIDIREINYRDYLKIFSTVYQDFFLFSFSFLENIAKTETMTQEELDIIMELFNNNGMGERLQKMYKGLNTPITKTLFASGVDLSGGERQKVAIIRALYKNSPVLILDEPTAALDPVSEHEIYRKFEELSEGKLTVYISHRIYSTRFCDKIAVFDKGEIKEYGTFEQLMNMKGLYYDFYQKQAEYFK